MPYWPDVINDAVDAREPYDCQEPEEASALEDSQPVAAAVEDFQPMAEAVAAVEDSQPMAAAAAAVEDSQHIAGAEDSQPVEVEDSQPLTATVLEEDSQPRPETELDSLPPVFEDSQPCPETELDVLPPVFEDSQPRPETELDVLPSVPETEVPCTQPDPPQWAREDGEVKKEDDAPQVPSRAKPAAKHSAKPAASKTKAQPRKTGASQEHGNDLVEDKDGLKELPMVTREHQQAVKHQKDKTRKMDDAREAPHGPDGRDAEPKGRGRGRGRGPGRGTVKRPASRQPAKGQKQARMASPVHVVVSEESGTEERNGEECRKDLTCDFEAAADKSEVKKVRTKQHKGDTNNTNLPADKDKADKRKRPSTKGPKEGEEQHGKGARKAKAPEQMTDVPKAAKAARKVQEPKEVPSGGGQVLRKATFAGRYCPARDGIASARFLVIRKVFEEKVERKLTGSVSSCEAGPKSKCYLFCPDACKNGVPVFLYPTFSQVLMIKNHSRSLQLKWWNFVFPTVVEAKSNDEELVLSKVSAFLALDAVRR